MENFKLGCRREEGRCPFSSPRGIRPETLRFRLPVLHNGSYISGNSMVLCLDGLRCGASENTKSRSLVFYCRRKTQILSLSLVHDKTKDFLYFTYIFTQLFGIFFRIITAPFVDDGHRNFDLHNI